MADLYNALEDLEAIRMQIARDAIFRGYGAETVAATGLMAVTAAGIQAVAFASPLHHAVGFLGIWISTAGLAALLTGCQTVIRTRRVHPAIPAHMLTAAAVSLLPSLLAAAIVTVALVLRAPQELWMLPGLWQIFYGLGIIASLRLMPRQMSVAGIWFLATGSLCLAAGTGPQSLSPWEMGFPFAIGQLLIAAILRLGDRNSEDSA